MEILGIGPLELLFILLIALIAVGPKDLGKAARSMGRLLNQLYKSEAWQNLGEASRNIWHRSSGKWKKVLPPA